MEGDRCGGNEVESISPPGSCRQLEQIEGAAVGGSLSCILDSEQSHMESRRYLPTLPPLQGDAGRRQSRYFEK